MQQMNEEIEMEKKIINFYQSENRKVLIRAHR